MVTNTAPKMIITVGQSSTKQNQTPEALSNGHGWQSVTENSVMGIAVADLSGRFLAANATYQKLLGYTEEDRRAFPLMGAAQENDDETSGALVRELVEGRRQQVQIEQCHRRKDGSSIWIRNQVSLLPSPEKCPRLLISV